MDQHNKLPSALKDLIPNHWKHPSFSHVAWPDRSVSAEWLKNLIDYMSSRHIPYSKFPDIPMLLVSSNGIQKYLWKINCNPKPLVQSSSFYSKGISDKLKSFLQSIGVYFVIDSDENINSLVRNRCIDVADSNSIVDRMKCNQRDVLQKFPALSESLYEEMCMILSGYQYQLPDLFKKLPLFKTVGGRFVSAYDSYIVNKSDLPTEWKDSYGNVVLQENITNQYLIQNLCMKRWTYEDVCKNIFNECLTNKDIISLSKGILLRLQSSYSPSRELQSLAMEYVRVKSDSGMLHRPCELFEKIPDLSNLFLNESGKFPDENYTPSVLRMIGLKSVKDVSINDIKQSIVAVQHVKRLRYRVEKVNVILSIIRQHGLSRSINYNFSSWIPIETESPRDYPPSMPWFGTKTTNSIKDCLKTPNEVFLPSYQYLVGSHRYIISSQVSKNFKSCFQGTPYEQRHIGLEESIKQLESLQQFYNPNEKGTFESMVKIIYDFIKNLIKVPRAFPVWHGDGFTTYQRTILIQRNMLDVSPYFFNPPLFVKNTVGNHLLRLGCQNDQFKVYLKTLQEIASGKIGTNNLADTKLALSLVKELATNFIIQVENNRESIFVPVESSELKLVQLDSCHYLDFDSETKFSTSSTDNIIHRQLSSEVARQLGIPNLVCKFFQGDEESLFEPWGQHQEPLTKNLKSILEGYADGLAIVNELIQNADDAGATEVSILYDKRMNENSKSRLISSQMKEWQGPALWVHNNKIFTEDDFKNITKLNAGTKRSEATKIGKFGLGFNAVYHLTDVPSILSGKSLVIFDPHMKYLGHAMKRGEPGIRIALHDRVSEISTFSDQFSVFEGVFGAHINLNSQVKSKIYDGSLFRFPLRNENCARTSEIKKLAYSEAEMRQLLTKVEDSLDVLLLFTQNVAKFSVYELDSTCQDPRNQKLLFSTHKSTNHPIKAVVDHANNNLQRFSEYGLYAAQEKSHTNEIDLTVTNNAVSTKKWVIHSRDSCHETYEYASKYPEEGLLPYCSLAFSLDNKDTKATRAVDGRLFCFLPLPIQNHLPAHVNASFKINKDRLGLKYHTEDEKNFSFEQEDWNDLISKDIGHAYYAILLFFKQKGISFDNFYNLFPNHTDVVKERFSIICLAKLLQLCYEADDAIFPVNKDLWKTWENLRIFDSTVPKVIIGSCISLMNWYFDSMNMQCCCLRLPLNFEALLHRFQFYENLTSLNWDYVIEVMSQQMSNPNFPTQSRNQIIIHLLEERKLDKTKLVHQPCIPTKPNGKLRRPDELVYEESKVSKLYNVTDEVFLDDQFMNFQNYLKSLGMKTEFLSLEMLIDRAKSIEKDFSLEKVKLLLELIGCISISQQNAKLIHQLRQCQFLPVMQKPNN